MTPIEILALSRIVREAEEKLARSPIRDQVAAISVGIVEGTPLQIGRASCRERV